MCGIVGVVSNKGVNEKLFKGLSNLEYRGYDSVGMCFVPSNSLNKKKEFFLRPIKTNLNSKSLSMTEINSHFQKLTNIPTKNAMNIINFIKFENYYCQITTLFQKKLKEKISNYSAIARRVNVSHKTVSRISNLSDYWMNFQTLLNISRLLNISKKEVYKHIKFIKTYNSYPVPFYLKNLNSPHFFRVIGHILGDGGIHIIKKESKYRAFYSNKRDELINSFEQDIVHLFGKIKLYKRTLKREVKEIWLPTSLGYIFYEFMEYEKNNTKRVPSFVCNLQNSKLMCSLLQALYDDEGFIYPQKNMIVIAQKSKILLNDIREVVKKVDINPNQILIHKPKNRTTMFYFSITGRKNIMSYAKKIGFLHPLKRKKLEILIKKYKVR